MTFNAAKKTGIKFLIPAVFLLAKEHSLKDIMKNLAFSELNAKTLLRLLKGQRKLYVLTCKMSFGAMRSHRCAFSFSCSTQDKRLDVQHVIMNHITEDRNNRELRPSSYNSEELDTESFGRRCPECFMPLQRCCHS
jgi:hypothetical protein